MNTVRRAAFLDRDGVINIDTHYLHRWEDFQYVPGAVDAMRQLHAAGYLLVVITNQSGIARGYYTEAQYQTLTDHMRRDLAAAGVPLAGVYHCPHHPHGQVAPYAIDCHCRKPQPGLILQALRDCAVSPEASLLVGDKRSDLQAGQAAGIGCRVLVRSGHAVSAEDGACADVVHDSLASFVTAHLGLSPSSAPQP